MNPALKAILQPAYQPCIEFVEACKIMHWDPSAGHVPRGFLGAAGKLTDVELILVFAEPGDPHDNECHTGLESAYTYATTGFREGKDLFHRNVRKILDMCWPHLNFDEQLRKVWMTDSVLCSAPKECGPVPRSSSIACGTRYLIKQLELFPNSLVVAMGGKAQERLRALGFNDYLATYAAAPPGCNHKPALESWELIPAALNSKKSKNSQLN